MRWRFRRATRPDPDDGRASAEEQHEMLNELARARAGNTMSDTEIAAAAMAMGPVRGSFGDYTGSRCHHMAPYPGCRGGCN